MGTYWKILAAVLVLATAPMSTAEAQIAPPAGPAGGQNFSDKDFDSFIKQRQAFEAEHRKPEVEANDIKSILPWASCVMDRYPERFESFMSELETANAALIQRNVPIGNFARLQISNSGMPACDTHWDPAANVIQDRVPGLALIVEYKNRELADYVLRRCIYADKGAGNAIMGLANRAQALTEEDKRATQAWQNAISPKFDYQIPEQHMAMFWLRMQPLPAEISAAGQRCDQVAWQRLSARYSGKTGEMIIAIAQAGMQGE